MEQNLQEYIGFKFNNKHSSEFGIVRVSQGSRFNENLLPTARDRSVAPQGYQGKIYQGSDYDTRVFSVSVAYDAMTEKQLQDMKTWLGDKKIHKLVFDELPYKAWYAKVTGTAQLKWIPFGETVNERIYKGEGTIQFTCFDPFAHCSQTQAKELYDYYTQLGLSLNANEELYSEKEDLEITNNLLSREESIPFTISEGNISDILVPGWWAASNFDFYKEIKPTINSTGEAVEVKYSLYNCGDVETSFNITISSNNIPKMDIELKRNGDGETLYMLELENFTLSGDSKIKINSKINLIEGYNGNGKSGNIYDSHIIGGSYFNLPVGRSDLIVTYYVADEVDSPIPDLDFDFLYL